MMLPVLAIILGLALMLWSANRFVEGAASSARHFGMPPLLIGMLIVGFGTSAPELLVSGLAAMQGNSGLALGNAYGSNITNIALIIGLTAVISPIAVHSEILRKELPILTLVTLFTAGLLLDLEISLLDSICLLGVFAMLIVWSLMQGLKKREDTLGVEVDSELQTGALPIRAAIFWLIIGLILLVISSRIMVWGAVKIAVEFGVSDLIIGLTIVAIGTSLPELASSIIAARKGEHDIALGNVIGSNLFNTLAVVGIAGIIQPIQLSPEILSRDVLTMLGLTLSLFILGYGFRRQGCINRYEGAALIGCYVGYMLYLVLNQL